MDVAQALNNLVQLPALAQTLNLPGPSTVTYEYLLDLIDSITYRPPSRAPTVPKAVALAISKASQAIWWPALSPDEVERRYIDDSKIEGDWDIVGVTPEELEPHAITYLRRFRSAYVLPDFTLLGSRCLCKPFTQGKLHPAGCIPRVPACDRKS